MSCRLRRDSNRLTLYNSDDRDLDEPLQSLRGYYPGAFTVMQSKVDDTEAGTGRYASAGLGRWASTCNGGDFVRPNSRFVDITPLEEFLKWARECVDVGAQLIGGGCGLGPEHIAALQSGLSRRPSSVKA